MSEYISIKNWADDDKPREKLMKLGKSALSNAELMTILISTGTKKKSALDLSKEILQLANNDLNVLARFSVRDLCKIDGIGPAKAISIIAAIELGGRRQALSATEKKSIKTSKDAFDMIKNTLQDLSHEEFWIYTLSQKNNVIAAHKISEGGITGTVVDSRKIFKIALEDKATGMILFHNHPSGNTQPSESDNKITKQLKEAGKLLEINVLDHIIVAETNYFSYADEGLF
ncbi:MAG: DNA repair protein RadC [Bacteroidota bacterium]|nr:DNA repair protein RadC [Bacteroidota bacterium]